VRSNNVVLLEGTLLKSSKGRKGKPAGFQMRLSLKTTQLGSNRVKASRLDEGVVTSPHARGSTLNSEGSW